MLCSGLRLKPGLRDQRAQRAQSRISPSAAATVVRRACASFWPPRIDEVSLRALHQMVETKLMGVSCPSRAHVTFGELAGLGESKEGLAVGSLACLRIAGS